VAVPARLWGFIGVLLLARLGLAAYAIERPGLQYDEVIFVNAGNERIGDSFIHERLLGVPVMLMSYIGALKSWIYTPVFELFGVSPGTIRGPAVALTTVGLVCLFAGVRRLLGTTVALVALVLVAVDNSVFWMTRDDVGPSAIEFTLKCLAILLGARAIARRRPRDAVLLAVVLALGVFNKLNFVWAVNAAAAISVVMAVAARDSLRTDRGAWIAWGGALAAIYLAFGAYVLSAEVSTGSEVSDLLAHTWTSFRMQMPRVLSGTWFYGYALAPLDGREWMGLLLAGMFTAGAVVALVRRRWVVCAFALATLLVVAQILVTQDATAGWHYLAVQPLFAVVVAYALVALPRALAGRWATHVTVAALAGWVVYSGTLGASYLDRLDHDTANVAWSPAIYRLADQVRDRDAAIFAADWGIYTPVLALDADPRHQDGAFTLKEPSNREWVRAQLEASRPLVVAHTLERTAFHDARSNLFEAAGDLLVLEETIVGLDGDPVFELYRVR
jgi:4-amino-4-deoxy-L-arabinose transferase-like glycosyltransferase